MNRAQPQHGGGARGNIAEPLTDLQGPRGRCDRGRMVPGDPEGVGQSRGDPPQPPLVAERPRDRFGRQVALEEAVRPRHRLQGHAQVEAQVDRLLLPPTALGEVLDGRQRIVVRQDGFLER